MNNKKTYSDKRWHGGLGELRVLNQGKSTPEEIKQYEEFIKAIKVSKNISYLSNKKNRD